MKQPILPEFADPSNKLVGLGPSGIVGVAGPFLPVRHSTTSRTTECTLTQQLLQFPLGYVQREFPNAYAEESSLEIENEIAKDLFVSVGYQFVHALKLPLYESINAVPSGTLPSGVQGFVPADPIFGFALEATPTAYSIYHAGTLSVRKPFAHTTASWRTTRIRSPSISQPMSSSPIHQWITFIPTLIGVWAKMTCGITSC